MTGGILNQMPLVVFFATPLAFVAVMAVALYTSHRSRTRPQERPKSVAWRVGASVAIWGGLVALVTGIFMFSVLLFWEDPPVLGGRDEGLAITYIAVRDGPFAEPVDAEALWSEVHDDIKAQTSRSEFIDCFFAEADRTAPDTAPDEFEPSLFERGVPNLFERAMYGGEVTSNGVLVRDGNTYSVADRRDDRGIIAVDVRVEGPQDTSVTTVLLSPRVFDPSDPGSGPQDWIGDQGLAVVGTAPGDSCLVGAEALRERLQTTGMISVGHEYGAGVPELTDYRVMAVVWDGTPDEDNLVGGAFWWIGDEGDGGDGVHPPSEGDGDSAEVAPSDGDEPRRAPDWVARAFVPAETVRLEPDTYTIEVWANPSELTPSANPRIPAETAERNCTIEVEVTAATHLDVFIKDIPTDGGECPHETEFRAGF